MRATCRNTLHRRLLGSLKAKCPPETERNAWGCAPFAHGKRLHAPQLASFPGDDSLRHATHEMTRLSQSDLPLAGILTKPSTLLHRETASGPTQLRTKASLLPLQSRCHSPERSSRAEAEDTRKSFPVRAEECTALKKHTRCSRPDMEELLRNSSYRPMSASPQVLLMSRRSFSTWIHFVAV